MASQPQLTDIAGLVADLTEIDWDALEAGVTSPADRATLARLRLLDRIVRACAEVVAPPSDAPPATWGQFTLHERVGHGTFGDVYRAHDRRLDRIVALKLLRRPEGPDPVGSEVIEEGRLLARIHHPNVITVYGAEQIDGRVGMWMEFVEGRTLEEELRASGPLPPDSVVTVGLALCGALAAVHDAGLLHRDLKAQNVMRAADGRIILTDFGAGRVAAEQPRDDASQELAGTPLYLAPEVLAGQPAAVSSELYGLGVLLYHLATGSFPVRGRTLQELRDAHASGKRMSIAAYRDAQSKPLVAVIDRAVAPEPSKRFGSVRELASALHRLQRPQRRAARWLAVPALLAIAATANWARYYYEAPLHVASTFTLARDRDVMEPALQFAQGGLVYYTDADGALFQSEARLDGPTTFHSAAPLPRGYEIVGVSATHSEFLALRHVLSTDKPLCIVDETTGQPRPVASIECQDAALSPDDKQVAYVSGGHLYVADISGANVKAMPMPPRGAPSKPRWSPDGDRLRFDVRIADGDLPVDQEIWEVRANATGRRQLLKGFNVHPAECCGAWSPDGSYYVFSSVQNGRTNLWALPERGNWLDWRRQGSLQPFRLTYEPWDVVAEHALIGSDGRTIFVVGTTTPTPAQQLVRYDAEHNAFLPYPGDVVDLPGIFRTS